MKTQTAQSTLYLQHDGGTLAYDDNGSGPLVVCVPGMGELRQEYRYLAPQLLAAGYRVVTMDVRGHGESSTAWSDVSVGAVGRDIVALVRKLEAGPAILIANSMACGAAACAATAAPELFAGLVLTGPAVRDGEGMPRWAMRLLLSTLFARPWGVAAWGKYYRTLYKTAQPPDFESYVAKLLANLREPGRLAVLRRMMIASKAASEAALSRVATPSLVIMGSKDPDFPDPAKEARLVAEKTHARLEMIDGAGHYPHVELPQPTNPLILAFCRQLSEPALHGA